MGRDILSLGDAFNYKPLIDNFIGFDSIFDRMEQSFNTSNTTYPPYDIYTAKVEYKDGRKTCNEEHTFIQFAVAGIDKNRLEVSFSPENILMVKTKPLNYAEISDNMEKIGKKYIRKGIADREFTIQKTISADLELVSCKMDNGLLTIEFRNVDKETMQTQIIDIE